MNKDDDGYMEENEDDDNDEEEDTFIEKNHRNEFVNISNVGGGVDLTPSKVFEKGSLSFNEEPKLKPVRRDSLSEMLKPLPLVSAGHSLLPDMQFGWKP